MEPGSIRRAVAWGAGAFILTVIHPVSPVAGLVITLIASVVGAVS